MKKDIAFRIIYRVMELLQYMGKDPAALDNEHCRKCFLECSAAMASASLWNSPGVKLETLEKHLQRVMNWDIKLADKK